MRIDRDRYAGCTRVARPGPGEPSKRADVVEEPTLARIRALTSKEELPPEAHAAFDSIVASRGAVRGVLAVMMHSPEVAARLAHLGTYLRLESPVPAGALELAVLTAIREFDCALEWSGHAQLAQRAAVSPAAISAIGSFGDLSGLPEEEALIIRFGRELLRSHRVSSDTFEAVRSRYGDQGLVDLAAIMGYYGLVANIATVAELEPAASATPLPARV